MKNLETRSPGDAKIIRCKKCKVNTYPANFTLLSRSQNVVLPDFVKQTTNPALQKCNKSAFIQTSFKRPVIHRAMVGWSGKVEETTWHRGGGHLGSSSKS